MPKAPMAHSTLPPIAAEALKKLGQNLKIARLRRRESRKLWAGRLGVSIPTLVRLEEGDPGISLGICATALWLALIGELNLVQSSRGVCFHPPTMCCLPGKL